MVLFCHDMIRLLRTGEINFNGNSYFSIALYEPYRGNRIGTALMRATIDELRGRGFRQAYLSVQKENPAVRFYERLGFEINLIIPTRVSNAAG